MSTYVSSRPYEGRYHLWGDTPDEGLGMAYCVGSSEADHQTTSLGNYLITREQYDAAQALGALRTDAYGPKRWFQDGLRGRAVCGPVTNVNYA